MCWQKKNGFKKISDEFRPWVSIYFQIINFQKSLFIEQVEGYITYRSLLLEIGGVECKLCFEIMFVPINVKNGHNF